MAAEDDNRINELRALIERLTGILQEASSLRQHLEQTIAGNRAKVERIGERKRRLLPARRKRRKQPRTF